MYVRKPFIAEGNWDQFENYCKLNGINIYHKDDWMPWWECWNAALNAALDAADNTQLESMNEDSIEWDDIPF